MSNNVNKVFVQGNLTRDPEVSSTQNGNTRVNFTVANNDTFAGEEIVNYVDVVAFGQKAETISKHFHKGKPIYVEGRLKQDKWDDKITGEKRSKMVVLLEDFYFWGPPSPVGENTEAAPKKDSPAKTPKAPKKPKATPVEDEEVIPF